MHACTSRPNCIFWANLTPFSLQLYAFGQSLALREDIARFAPTLLYCGSRGGLILSGLPTHRRWSHSGAA
jgi:hypothetical protein